MMFTVERGVAGVIQKVRNLATVSLAPKMAILRGDDHRQGVVKCENGECEHNCGEEEALWVGSVAADFEEGDPEEADAKEGDTDDGAEGEVEDKEDGQGIVEGEEAGGGD